MMKKSASLVLASILALGVMSTSAFADVKSGQKAYLKMFKAKFGMDGTKFAASHTVAEWEALFANDAAGFIKEYSEKFPAAAPALNAPNNKDAIKNVGDFVKEYGSDSGNVPSCG